MLIIRRIFHISTRPISSIFTIVLCLALWFLVATSFFWLCARCFLSPHHITVYMFVAAIALLRFLGVGMCLTSWFFLQRTIFFDFRRLIARLPFVCVVFPVLVAYKHFFLTCLPPMSQVCSDVFQLFFQRFMWNIVVFSMKYYLFSVCFLQYPGRYSAVFVVFSFWCLRVVTRFCAACASIVFYWLLSELDVVA